jgi:hypothetical protein
MAKMEKESKSEMKKEMAADKKQDVAMIKKAFKEHDAQEHKGGKGTKIVLKKGGLDKPVKMAKGGVTQANLRSMGRNMARVANQKSSSRGR